MPTLAAREEPSRWRAAVGQIVGGSAGISVLAVVLALLVGAVLIAVTDAGVQSAAGYFFARPGDTLQAIGRAVGGAYAALFQGAIWNVRRDTFAGQIKPITDTLTFATPLIAAGLGVALAFRVGLFNIGAQGQLLVGAIFAGWVATHLQLPYGIHLIVAVIAGIVGGAVWGGIAGILRARTGAHEVIVTIMLNYVAVYLLTFLLKTPVLQAPGSTNPKSAAIEPTAELPQLFGVQFQLHLGFVLAIIATAVVWFVLNRSSLGFRFRAVGENPHAARVAGMNVKNLYLWAMLISGGLAGLAATSQVLGGSLTSGFSVGVDAGIGFDAITVALLGRSRPVGVFVAGVLFGAFKAGGYTMQAAQNVPVDVVLVVQSIIVLLIAAPPLVRAVFRLPIPVPRAPRAARPSKAEVSQ
ncbi:ABC transporter permease [Galbitalea sp. SE-J8]|uniref:ABC transporter permease n=1 Tax=Galbitalea sp. SE-J8 TaxID=3054952 RepID=UPI00259CF1DF|nr:ABC transporter permease [Galbitalea sp. SE-J8]MDM4762760.1 ABC transporter permease [Galbitalea sp. SE-J8]